MKKCGILSFLLISLIALIANSDAVSAVQEGEGFGQSQMAKLDITVSSVKRASSWQPPSGPFPGTKALPIKAKEGEEIVVVHLNIRASKGIVSLHGFALVDTAGRSYEALIMGWEGTAAPSKGLDIPFSISKGAKLKKFKLKEPNMEINLSTK